LFVYKKKKEIGSLRKNGHLFLSIFRNLEDKFLFYVKKIGSLENALKTTSIIFVRLHKNITQFYANLPRHIFGFHHVSKNACHFIYNNNSIQYYYYYYTPNIVIKNLGIFWKQPGNNMETNKNAI
jgi:hypothetical protein